MLLPKITLSQKRIINYIYSFRFLTISQLQQLFNHKDSKTIREWLIDLRAKKYIDRIKDPKDVTKPIVFCLAQRAGHILKGDDGINENFLLWLYKEKKKEERFIQRHLFIADAYLYFLKNREKGQEINFFTKQDLFGYEYFPDPLPDAYIDVKERKGNTRYFFEYFDEKTPSGVIRYRVRYYFEYADISKWQKNTDNAPFPVILFVLPNERRKRHIAFYAKALIEKSYNDLEFFLTIKENIKFAGKKVNIWQKVE